jgi:DNA-binding transcriptional LysR family regulator
MDIEKFRSFITAAGLGSFSEAAEELFLTTSAVSKHVAALEAAFGTELLHRGARQLELTDSGRVCLDSAKTIVGEYDRLFSSLSSSALTVLSIPFQSFIVPLLADFEQHCPGVSLRLRDMHGPAIVSAVAHGEFELGFAGSVYSNSPETEQLIFDMEPLGVLLPKGHRLAGRGSVSIKELRNERFCLMAPETGLYGGYIGFCRKNGFSPQIISTSAREDTLIALVASGRAVSLFTQCEIAYHDCTGTRLVPLDEHYDTGFALLRRRGGHLSPSASALWEYIAGIAQGRGY